MARTKRRRKRKRRRKMIVRKSLYHRPHHFILRNAVELQTNVAGTIIGAVNVNTLTKAYTASDTTTFTGLLETSDFVALFDQYRVNGVKLRFMPSVNTYQVAVPGAGGPPNFSGPLAHVALAYDIDNVGQPGNFSELLTRDYVKVMDISKKWSHYQKVARTIQPGQTQSNGWLNLQSEANNTAGCIWIRGDRAMTSGGGGGDPLATVTLGYLLIEFYCSFRKRQ